LLERIEKYLVNFLTTQLPDW